MAQERVSLGFDDVLDEFNPDEWQPSKSETATRKPQIEATAEAAKAAGFKSREAKSDKIDGTRGNIRRRRTGRNAQFNLKARPETIEAYCAIADVQDWGLGETLEKAVELLEQYYSKNHK